MFVLEALGMTLPFIVPMNVDIFDPLLSLPLTSAGPLFRPVTDQSRTRNGKHLNSVRPSHQYDQYGMSLQVASGKFKIFLNLLNFNLLHLLPVK